ncbi:conjugal transfer protein TraH [Marinobacterium aestuariivivens]|uniref:Conjugal transfer protein TraH n=1 Tax=Marinobacterium aestuariivivens TaxID=1698799 RepID=A0ABW2A9B7_9GAMM
MKPIRYSIKTLTFSIAFSLATLAVPEISRADLQDEMDSFFGDMSNTTTPGVFETQRRGVLSGGRYTAKSKIFDENLISFAPPSWKGGCGGIDMFNGSFSFVSAEQIVQLLRQVAANAKGYAFQLALDNVCPDCAKHIEAFQKKIQALNQHLGNSCQLAQGIVNDTTSSFEMKGKTDASIAATVTGVVTDVFSAREETETGKTPEEQMSESELLRRELIGNIVWQQLKKQNAKNWFTYGDDALLETMMSLTGTIIRQPPIADPDHVGDPADASKTLPLVTKPAKPDILRAILEGGSVKIYDCDTADKCLEPGERTANIEGLGKKVEDMLLGTGSNIGIIAKFARNQGTLNASEKAFISNLPAGAGTIVRNLSVLSEDASRIFALKASNSIALTMVYTTTEELFRAVSLVVSQSKAPHQSKAFELISKSQDKVRNDYHQLRAQFGDVADLITHYNSMLDNLRKQRYTLSTLTSPQRTKE